MESSQALSAPPILSQAEAFRALEKRLPPSASGFIAFYSSVSGSITNDPAAFVVPLDDHMVHRGHAVFDTCNVRHGKAYGLDFHLDRLLRSAGKARIDSPFTKEQLRQIILATIASTHQRDDIFVRFWMSVGRGDFWITPTRTFGANFYCVVHRVKEKAEMKVKGVKEYVVGVPLKPPHLATIKSNNYLINALTGMESEEKGGYIGIQLDAEQMVAESSIANVAILDDDMWLRTPPFDQILAGTTVKRLFELVQPFVDKGEIKGVLYSEISLEELMNAKEVYSLGGGHIVPIISIDDQPIGDGRPGPFFKKFDCLLEQDMDTNFVDDIPYHLYSSTSVVAKATRRIGRFLARCLEVETSLLGLGMLVMGYYLAKSRGGQRLDSARF